MSFSPDDVYFDPRSFDPRSFDPCSFDQALCSFLNEPFDQTMPLELGASQNFSNQPLIDKISPSECYSTNQTRVNTPLSSVNSSFDEVYAPCDSRKRSLSPDTRSTGNLQSKRRSGRFETKEKQEETAETRKKGPCIRCQMTQLRCTPGLDPDGSCERCQKSRDKGSSGAPVVYQPCWRVKISDIEVFRRGPSVAFAWSMRWINVKADKNGKSLWKPFRKSIADVPSRRGDTSREVHLSQGWCSKPLILQVDRYQPAPTDKQHYEWFDNGIRKLYLTPAYTIADPDDANHAIARFLDENMEEYIDFHMKNSTAITRLQFELAKSSLNKPLIHLALKLWVACRFIETPWSIIGSETLGMVPDPEPNSPYHRDVPVTPMMDHQIDNLVIHNRLQPLLTMITKILDKLRKRVRSNGKKDWMETQLTYFILMHNIELTVAHDVAFARRYNLPTQYSNMPLIDMVVHGANTLLTYFHHAHQGYAPFCETWSVEQCPDLSQEQKSYVKEFRSLLQQLRGDYVHNPAKELFWTSQLFKPEWRPVVLVVTGPL